MTYKEIHLNELRKILKEEFGFEIKSDEEAAMMAYAFLTYCQNLFLPEPLHEVAIIAA
jgi:hypothetical protein